MLIRQHWLQSSQKVKGSGGSSADTVGVACPCQFPVLSEPKKSHLIKPSLKVGVAKTTYHLQGLIFVEAQAILHKPSVSNRESF